MSLWLSVLPHTARADPKQQECEGPDGPLSCSVHVPGGVGSTGQEPGQVQVGDQVSARGEIRANLRSFMFDKIMPLSEAVEGYDLFDQMKVQKVIFKP